MRLLVIGASSKIYSALRFIFEQNFDEIALISSDGRCAHNGKVYQPDGWQSLSLSYNADVVLYMASSLLPRDPIEKAINSYQKDVSSFLKYLPLLRGKKLIYFSSAGSVYGNCDQIPHDEKMALEPISMYGLSKAHIESIIEYSSKIINFEYKILRLSNPFGINSQLQPFKFGLIYAAISRFKVKGVLDIYASMETRKDYIPIKDLEYALNLMLHTPGSGIYNLGSGESLSIEQILTILEGIFGYKIDLSYSEPIEGDVADVALDVGKLKSIGFQGNSSFEKSIIEMIDYV
jgi:UDP-glucose 4-epimerase